jgi:phosphoglycerate dehydrogenase-like enzyme
VIRIAVLDDYQAIAHRFADWEALQTRAEVVFFHDTPADFDALVARLSPFDIIAAMRERTPFPRTLVARLPRLKMIVSTGMQNRAFDMAALRDHGVVATGTPSTYDTTAELTWTMIHALMRRLVQEDRALHAGGWQNTIGRGLRGSVLGLLGLGKIAKQVAAVAHVFGMRVIAWSPNLTLDRCAEHGVEYVDRATLFSTADVLSIHMVLSKRTQGLVSRDDLRRMKSTSYLINTSRGPLIDEDALIEILEAKGIAGAGLDTYRQEPLPADHRLRRIDSALLTPHVGYVTEEHYSVFYQATIENIIAYLDGVTIRPLREHAT